MNYPYEIPYAEQSVFKKDFDGRVDVIPVSDPNIPSNAHRMMLAQMALQMAQQSPTGMFNIEALNRTILNAANMPNIEEILPPKKEPQQMDPISDIMAATKGIPIKAFEGQNHDAHIQTKMAYLQDPQNGANPIMARLRPILEANIQEHSIMKYQEQVNGITRMGLEQLPPEQSQVASIAEMAMAQAAQQVLNANQAMGQAQSPEQQLVALKQAEVGLKEKELKMEEAKLNVESSLDAQKLQLEEAKLMKDAGVAGQNAMMKKEKGDLDRQSKETMKLLDLLAKSEIAEKKSEIDLEKIRTQSLEKVANMDSLDETQRSMKLLDVMSKAILQDSKND